MEINILKLAAIITALSVIFGVIIGGYKMYDKLIDDNKELERRSALSTKWNTQETTRRGFDNYLK